jgi:hypothetical protein
MPRWHLQFTVRRARKCVKTRHAFHNFSQCCEGTWRVLPPVVRVGTETVHKQHRHPFVPAALIPARKSTPASAHMCSMMRRYMAFVRCRCSILPYYVPGALWGQARASVMRRRASVCDRENAGSCSSPDFVSLPCPLPFLHALPSRRILSRSVSGPYCACCFYTPTPHFRFMATSKWQISGSLKHVRSGRRVRESALHRH